MVDMDAKTLSEAMGGALSLARYQQLLPAFEASMRAANITTALRAAHFCAQLGHESVGLKYQSEIWGPTATQKRYEGRRDLGNTVAGDGSRFRGHGWIQITGRHNHTEVSKWAHGKGLVPTSTYFVDHPEALGNDQYAGIGPAWYWTVARPNLNSQCDRDDVVAVTKSINGGTNGLQDRKNRLARCKKLGNRLLPSGGTIKAPVVNGKKGVMKDWDNLEAEVTKIMNKHYTPGRGGRKIKYIVRHHNAGNRLTVEQCWQLWQTREASAHYQVEANGRIGQLVNDWDTAWHAANQQRNQESIGIEHANTAGADQDWPISDTTIEEGAHLAAALCRYYNLGRPQFGVNIRDHKETGQTACPYHLANGGKYHARWMERAQYHYDNPRAGVEDDMFSDNDRLMLAEIRNQLTGSHKVKEFPGYDLAKLAETARGKRTKGQGVTLMETVALNWAEDRLTGDQLNGAGRKDGSRTFNGWSVDDVLAVARKRNFVGLTLVQMVVVGLFGTDADRAAVQAQISREEA